MPATGLHRDKLTCLSLLLIVLQLAACAEIRLFTYPSYFVWLDESEVQGVMHDMATHIERIEQWVDVEHGDQNRNATPGMTRVPRDEIIAALEDIEVLAMSLKSTGDGRISGEPRHISTSHRLIDENIDEFIAGVNRALRQVNAEPPGYYAAGQLAGNCTACHRRG